MLGRAKEQSLSCLCTDLRAGSEATVWLAGGSQSSKRKGPLTGLEERVMDPDDGCTGARKHGR